MPDRRRGFGRIDVLIVLSVLAVIAAMALPAIQQARQAALRSSCHCRMKIFGSAMFNYHETFATFPFGWIVAASADATAIEPSAYAWGTMILPHLDLSPTYKLVNFQADDPSFQAEATRLGDAFAGKPISSFMCPASRGTSLDHKSSVPVMANATYVGNFGVGLPTLWHDPALMQGIFGANSHIRIEDVRDGGSNTILVGERRLVPDGEPWLSNQIDGRGNSYWAGIPRGVSPLAVVATVTDGALTETGPEPQDGILNRQGQLNGWIKEPRELTLFRPNQPLEVKKLRGSPQLPTGGPITPGFSSDHPEGGFVVLMGDGSANFINNQIAPETLINLMRRADGQILGDF